MAPGDTGQGRLTRLGPAREQLRRRIEGTSRTVDRSVKEALGLHLAEGVEARTPYPAFDKVTTDGYAVRAADTFDASDRTPVRLELTEDTVERREAVRVDAGDELPDGADAVVAIADVNRRDTTVELLTAVPEGAGVVPTGKAVEKGERVLDPGHRLRPSDIALLRAVGHESVAVVDPRTVAIVPTGDRVVTHGPSEGEVLETNSQIIEGLLGQWGGRAATREPVVSKPAAIRTAIERDLDADAILTIGGTADGADDHVSAVLDTRGELLADGLAVSPGRTTAIGVVERTPVIAAPGPPTACLVAAVQLLRPVLGWLGQSLAPARNVDATLTDKLPSQPGVRTFAPVGLEYRAERAKEGNLPNAAEPVRAGTDGLRGITRADGWVTVPEPREGYDPGANVTVEEWESK